MALKPGTQLGSYEIIALIGAGGMGEVYRARDAKLNRLVALKVLPPALAENRDFLARFEREAKAVAALSHPNVLGIFDFATQDGLAYAVMELLEGDSLRDRLKAGALPVKRAVEIAAELALGLGAAHERGLVHRDVKPENIFVTKEGRVKVLDFGLAKQVVPAPAGSGNLATEALSLVATHTQAGQILGTAGYMSPEQVRGEAADHRADVFAFGVVLYEMLSGQRPFKGDSAVQTMSAILEQDPPTLVAARGPLPPVLEGLVAHCLEKHPEGRFQSMKDIAFALQSLSTATGEGPGKAPAPAPGRRPALLFALGVTAMVALEGLSCAFHLPPFGPRRQPTFTRLTFAPGTVESARFGPDGRTIFFSQRLQGGPPEIYVIHADSSEAKPLGVTNALLMGVSPGNELALLTGPHTWYAGQVIGTLAQVSSEGGAVKEIQEHVLEGTWLGQGLATIATDETERQLLLDFPPGRNVFQVDGSDNTLQHLRVSRDGTRMAVVFSDGATKSEILSWDRQGTRKVLFSKPGDLGGDTLTGLAWGPDGDLWCSELQGDQTEVWSLTPGGKPRIRWCGPGTCELMDVSSEGRLLLVQQQVRRSVAVLKAGEAQPRDVSVLGGTQGEGLSEDGRTLLLLESGVIDGGTAQDLAYLRHLDGTPALRLAKGKPRSLSPDGKWMFLMTDALTPQDLDPAISAAYERANLDPKVVLDPRTHLCHLVLVPTGLGRPQVLALPPRFEALETCVMHPDGRTLIFNGNEKGKSPRWYVMDRDGGEPKPLTSEELGVVLAGLVPLSPDGKRFLAYDNKRFFIQALAGGPPQPIQNLNGDEDYPVRWSVDGKSIFLRSRNTPLVTNLTRLDLATGARHPVLSFTLPELAGFQNFRSVDMTADARTCAFTYSRKLSELFVVDGVE